MSAINILSRPPEIHPISAIQIPEVLHEYVEQVPVYRLCKKDCGVVLVDIVFYAGRPHEKKQLAAAACAPMMREGAGAYDSDALSEEIDYRGASITVSSSLDLITARMVCLKKHLPEMIILFGEVLSDPHFDKAEFDHFIQRRIERLQHELSKNDVISYRELTASIYGSMSPYGYNSSPEMYRSLDIEDVRIHYRDTITRNNCVVFMAGDLEEKDNPIIASLIARIPSEGKRLKDVRVERADTQPERIFLEGNPLQSSIKMGRKGIPRNHIDFYPLNFLNTLFGGFFGSRLVTNVRESLGMTYGIYSMLDQHLYNSSLIISTEVTNENVKACIKEIHNEMRILQDKKVSEEEIMLVRHYMMGNYLNLFDGPFNSLKAIKSLVLREIPLEKVGGHIEASISIDAGAIMTMARKYFNSEDYWEVVVGTALA